MKNREYKNEQEKRDYENAKREWESNYWRSKDLPPPYHTKIKFWKGAESRKVEFFDPCSCGCDNRDNPYLLGYLSGSNDDGDGFTLPIHDQETYDQMRKIIPHRQETS